MKFTTADHNKFLTGGGRDYGVFVLFTATDPAFNCQNCKYALFLHVVRFTRTTKRKIYCLEFFWAYAFSIMFSRARQLNCFYTQAHID
jgi:hypothetical protein